MVLFCTAILQFRMVDQLQNPNCFPKQFFRTRPVDNDTPWLDEFMRHIFLFLKTLKQRSSSYDKDGFQELISGNSSLLNSIVRYLSALPSTTYHHPISAMMRLIPATGLHAASWSKITAHQVTSSLRCPVCIGISSHRPILDRLRNQA
jgi:cytochrome c-type biogenesis protein CcmH/NrfF